MTYRVEELDDRYAGTKLTTLPRDLNDRLLGDVRLDEYQEPFHENKYREPPHAAYYGYSTVVIDNKDLHDSVEQSGEWELFFIDKNTFLVPIELYILFKTIANEFSYSNVCPLLF